MVTLSDAALFDFLRLTFEEDFAAGRLLLELRTLVDADDRLARRVAGFLVDFVDFFLFLLLDGFGTLFPRLVDLIERSIALASTDIGRAVRAQDSHDQRDRREVLQKFNG